ncbi:glycosyltransferase family 39 protein [Porticoccus sp.]
MELSSSKNSIALYLTLMALFMIGVRWLYKDLPLEMDSATYSIIAEGMLSGGKLYTDYWDIKPPLIFILYAAAQLIAGPGEAHILLLSIAASIATLAGIYTAAKQGPGGEKTGLFAALLWTIVSADRIMQGNYPNTEIFINALMVWATALTLSLLTKPQTLKKLVLIGALFALSSLLKHVCAIPAAFISLAYLYIKYKEGITKQGLQFVIVIGATGALAWALIFGYFFYNQRLPEAWDALVTFNQGYAGNMTANILSLSNPLIAFPPNIFRINLILVLATCSGAYWILKEGISSRSLIFIAYFFSSGIAVALPGKFHAHYYLLWLPVLCIGSAWAIERVWHCGLIPRRPALYAFTCCALLAYQITQMSMPMYKVPEIGPRLAYNYILSPLINEHLGSDENFLQWGHNVELYYYTNHSPPIGELRAGHILKGNRGQERATKVLFELKNNPPKLVILARGWKLRDTHMVESWISDNYHPYAVSYTKSVPNIGIKFYELNR